jgi:cyclic pyranopterin phosphate synthase
MVSISAKDVTSRSATAVCTLHFSNPTAVSLIRSNNMKKGDVLSVARIAGIMAAKKTSDLIPLCHPIAISRVKVELEVIGSETKSTTSRGETSIPWAGTGQGDAYVWHEPHRVDLALDPKARVRSKSTAEDIQKRIASDAEPQKNTGGTDGRIEVTATVECDGKTGVEMEALSAASVAALTVYDMCKAVDKGMIIEGLKVVRKEGGKSGTWAIGGKIESETEKQ